MAVTTNSIVTPQAPVITPITIVNADASNKKTACTAGSNGTKVVSLTACSDDTSNRIVQVFLTRSATNYLLGSAVVTTLAGTDGATAVVDLLNNTTIFPGLPVDNDGQRYLFLKSGDTLTVASTTTVTAAKTVTITCNSADF